jgi:hypothetical protein
MLTLFFFSENKIRVDAEKCNYIVQPDVNVFTDLSKNLNLNKFKGGGMQQPYWGPYVGQVSEYEIRSDKKT